ncbi:hypothetical protein L1987_68708 [Smallanthus sonchifolius]|uniref:Uncharacterized protein n=1 Tax=Smallanthus sonchifolius TaxID=185202 RepID=A0ACB9B3Y1_9ASTR|nr:hypothetical protein L1987_68708 [Smallanthus sonchifolius]
MTKNKVKENEEEAKVTGACLREEPELKRRKMSVKRDFPPGCRPSGTNDDTQEPDGESMASDTEEEPKESMIEGEVYGDNEDFVLLKNEDLLEVSKLGLWRQTSSRGEDDLFLQYFLSSLLFSFGGYTKINPNDDDAMVPGSWDGNIRFTVCQSPFSLEVPSNDPSGVSAHSVQTLQTTEYDENKELQFKMARANRKQKLASKKLNPSSSSALQCGYSKKSSKKIYSGYNKGSDQDGRVVYTRDNVKLSLLMRKMLTCSDVGDLGRILLPKREVEENLPCLATKQGVDIVIREVFSDTQWRMKYRFWANQKGNIYLFDQCANFVKKNSLQAGDHLELYHDNQKNLYYTVQKKGKGAAQPSNLQENVRESYLSMMLEASGEEELSWRLLMKELNGKE